MAQESNRIVDDSRTLAKANEESPAISRDNHAVSKRLQKELMSLMMSPDKSVSAFPDGENLFKWIGTITGPVGTKVMKQLRPKSPVRLRLSGLPKVHKETVPLHLMLTGAPTYPMAQPYVGKCAHHICNYEDFLHLPKQLHTVVQHYGLYLKPFKNWSHLTFSLEYKKVSSTVVANSVYEGLVYKLSLEFPHSYPYTAPLVRFATPCYHPNVDMGGNICLDILKEKWSALYDVRTILLSIQSLLSEPNNESPLNVQAAALWSNKVEYKRFVHIEYHKNRKTH